MATNDTVTTTPANIPHTNSDRHIASHFRLADDIDASGTGDWDFDRGFRPIGSSTESAFSGSLDGNGFEISGLVSGERFFDEETGATIATSSPGSGLFYSIAEGGEVRDLTLRGVLISGADAGAFAAMNAGLISGVSASGSVYGSTEVFC